MPDEEGCEFPSTTKYPALEAERATYPWEEDHFLTPGRAQVWSAGPRYGRPGPGMVSRELGGVVEGDVDAWSHRD